MLFDIDKILMIYCKHKINVLNYYKDKPILNLKKNRTFLTERRFKT